MLKMTFDIFVRFVWHDEFADVAVKAMSFSDDAACKDFMVGAVHLPS